MQGVQPSKTVFLYELNKEKEEEKKKKGMISRYDELVMLKDIVLTTLEAPHENF